MLDHCLWRQIQIHFWKRRVRAERYTSSLLRLAFFSLHCPGQGAELHSVVYLWWSVDRIMCFCEAQSGLCYFLEPSETSFFLLLRKAFWSEVVSDNYFVAHFIQRCNLLWQFCFISVFVFLILQITYTGCKSRCLCIHYWQKTIIKSIKI